MELVVKNPSVNAGEFRDADSIQGQEDPLKKGRASCPVFLPGESHG